MNLSIRMRAAVGAVTMVIAGVMAGCGEQEPEAVDPAESGPASEPSSQPSSPGPVGSAMAKGAELTAVAVVRAWVSDRDDALAAPGCAACDRFRREGRWTVVHARVTRHSVNSATVEVRVLRLALGERRRFVFEVARVAGEPAITRIVEAERSRAIR